MKPPPGVPLIGQQPSKQQMAAQIQAAINQLSVGIYTHLATAHIDGRHQHDPVDQDRLRELAKEAQAAGRCYFEGLGIIQQEKGDSEAAQ